MNTTTRIHRIRGLAEVIIGKHRNSPTEFRVRIAFLRHYSRFENAAMPTTGRRTNKQGRNGAHQKWSDIIIWAQSMLPIHPGQAANQCRTAPDGGYWPPVGLRLICAVVKQSLPVFSARYAPRKRANLSSFFLLGSLMLPTSLVDEATGNQLFNKTA